MLLPRTLTDPEPGDALAKIRLFTKGGDSKHSDATLSAVADTTEMHNDDAERTMCTNGLVAAYKVLSYYGASRSGRYLRYRHPFNSNFICAVRTFAR